MFDVIVVGAGVAGCSFAKQLNAINSELNVLILEKNKKVFLRDSGIVSKRFFDFYSDKSIVLHSINKMVLQSPSGEKVFFNSERPFAHILDRNKFTQLCREEAKKAAKIRYETVTNIEYAADFVSVTTDRSEYKCKIIVGADGPASIVRRFAKIKRPRLYTGILVRTKKPLNVSEITVYLNKYFSPDFFSWVIPQIGEYGLISGMRPMQHFEYFRRALNLPEGDKYAYLVPLGYTKSYAERTLLIGDSCGQVKPISGGGIIFSLICSRFAAEAVTDALEEDNFQKNYLYVYEHMWKRRLKKEIKRQLLARKIYRKLSNRDIDKIAQEFGPYISKTAAFDYDELSYMWKSIPKLKLIKFAIKNLNLFF